MGITQYVAHSFVLRAELLNENIVNQRIATAHYVGHDYDSSLEEKHLSK